MDAKNYKSYWSEVVGEVPGKRLNVQSHIWDKSQGEQFFNDLKYKNVICKKIKDYKDIDEGLDFSSFSVKPVGDTVGHMLVKDNTVTEMVDVVNNYPIMPNYVRDLAGRVICIAECFPLQKEAAKTKLFPQNAFCIDENYEGADLIENVFFSCFRTLDISGREVSDISDGKRLYIYQNANLHPYKLRVDTFYQDGWRLPQTEMLFVNRIDDEDSSSVKHSYEDFMAKWQASSNKDNYEDFYEECGGEEYFNSLFEKGVTLIPTIEAYNADAIVNREFELVDYRAGKYVAEFHEIVEYVDSELSSGSIVKVIEPGYATYNDIKKARVIVSNGRNYVSKNSQDPAPMIPNFKLPHSRTSVVWGDVYIPTHPQHFEGASIWGWCYKTGVFLQEKGPIWDPLHYFYESVDKIIYYYQYDALEDNGWLFGVPDDMKRRFYPVVPFSGYDIFDYYEKEDRAYYRALPYTNCKRYELEEFSADIGYHPMPALYEFEIDSWAVPELSPRNRVITDASYSYQDRLVDVICCNVKAKDYLDVQNANSTNNPYWFNEIKVGDSSQNIIQDYSYLKRYLNDSLGVDKVKELMQLFLFVDDSIDTNYLLSEYVSKIELPKNIDSKIRDFTVAFYEFKEKSFSSIKSRSILYQSYRDDYLMCSWNSSSNKDLNYMLKDQSVLKLEESKFSSVAIMQPPTF